MPHDLALAQADGELAERLSLHVSDLLERPGFHSLSRHPTGASQMSQVTDNWKASATVEVETEFQGKKSTSIESAHYKLVVDATVPGKYGYDSSVCVTTQDAAISKDTPDILLRFPDGGYGWFVVLSTFLVNMTLFGYTYSWGVYQQLYLEHVYVGRITNFQITFVGSLATALMFSLGPFFGVLRKLIGLRWLMVAGAITQPLGLLLASFSQQPWHLYLTHGVLAGVGSCLIFFPSVFLPTQWFLRRRGLATGIAVSGSGLGGLTFGPLTRALIDKSGYRWCLRYFAIGSFVILFTAILLARECRATMPAEPPKDAAQKRKEKMIDVTILGRPDFAAMAMMAAVTTFGYMAPFFFLPSFATFIGLTANDGALFIGLSTGVNAIGRIVLGHLADRFGRVNSLFLCVFFAGLTILLIWVFSTTYITLLIFVLLYGFSAGGFISLFPVVTAELVGLDELPNAVGVLYSTCGLGNLLGPAIAGALLDMTRPNTNYLPVQLFCGLTTILGSMFIIWLRTLRTKKLFAIV